MAKTKKVKVSEEEVKDLIGPDTEINTREEMVEELGEEEVSKIEAEAEDIEIVPEPVEEVEMYNGKRVIEKGEVEIHGVIHKTITTEEGSTYTL